MKVFALILFFVSTTFISVHGQQVFAGKYIAPSTPLPDSSQLPHDTIPIVDSVRRFITFYSGAETDPVQTGPAPYAAAGFNDYIQQSQVGQVTRSTVRHFKGASAFRFQVDRDLTQVTGEGHSQMTFISKPAGLDGEGDNRWYGCAYYRDSIESLAADIHFIRQWHHDASNGSPPMGLAVESGRLKWDYIITNGGSDNFADLGAAPVNRWFSVVIHIIHSSNSAIALTEIWVDGVKKLAMSQANGNPAATKFVGLDNIAMFGLYKWVYKIPGYSPVAQVVIWGDEFRIGDGNAGATYKDVAP